MRSKLHIPVIANGEIWNWQDSERCRKITGCDDLMIGRGALNIPNLSKVIKYKAEKSLWHNEVMPLLQSMLIWRMNTIVASIMLLVSNSGYSI